MGIMKFKLAEVYHRISAKSEERFIGYVNKYIQDMYFLLWIVWAKIVISWQYLVGSISNLSKIGLWDTRKCPFMSLRKLGFIINQIAENRDFRTNFGGSTPFPILTLPEMLYGIRQGPYVRWIRKAETLLDKFSWKFPVSGWTVSSKWFVGYM
jgi:hypothetical protein